MSITEPHQVKAFEFIDLMNRKKKDLKEIFKDAMKNNNRSKSSNEQIRQSDGIERKRMLKSMEKRENVEIFLKLKMMLGVRGLKGILYVRILLEKIKISKKMFMEEIENGEEVFIPSDLSQDHFPMSFKYYDPIIAIISENISD